jgi:hypothetical protein
MARSGRRTDRISAKDLAVLEFVSRFGVLSREVVALRAETARSVTLARERRLRIAGLVEVMPAFGELGPIVVPTRKGLHACGRHELRVPRFSYWRVVHSVEVARVAARLELRGHRVLSEREIAAREAAEGKRIFSARRDDDRYHRPDLALLGPGVEAVEVELSDKARWRLEAILRSWAWSMIRGEVDRVVYLCPPEVRRHVEQAVLRARCEDCVGVGSIASLDGLTPPGPQPESQITGAQAPAVKGRRPDPEGVDREAGAARLAAQVGQFKGPALGGDRWR